MKKKYFCYFYGIFLGTMLFFASEDGFCATKNKLSEEDLIKIQKIKEANKEQTENSFSIEKYQKENPNLMKAKPDEYWDLAWHARLADYGDEESQYVIARAYEKGIQVEQNPKKAVAFYEKACDKEHIEACMRLGEIYFENKWLKADEEKSLYWYEKAGKAGYVQAQLKVSRIYKEKGDYISALKWLEKGLKKLFPQSENLEESAPELAELKRLSILQEKLKKRGVEKTVLHEMVVNSLTPRTLKKKNTLTKKSVMPIKNSKVKTFRILKRLHKGGV